MGQDFPLLRHCVNRAKPGEDCGERRLYIIAARQSGGGQTMQLFPGVAQGVADLAVKRQSIE